MEAAVANWLEDVVAAMGLVLFAAGMGGWMTLAEALAR